MATVLYQRRMFGLSSPTFLSKETRLMFWRTRLHRVQLKTESARRRASTSKKRAKFLSTRTGLRIRKKSKILPTWCSRPPLILVRLMGTSPSMTTWISTRRYPQRCSIRSCQYCMSVCHAHLTFSVWRRFIAQKTAASLLSVTSAAMLGRLHLQAY